MPDDEEYYGEKLAYDPSFKGPRSEKRSCTDVVYLCLLLVYIGFWIGVAIYAVHNGNLKKTVAPKSSFRSQLCGYDPAVKNKPYLMFFDLSKCFRPIPAGGCNTPHVCVEKCPDKPFLWDTVNRSSFNPKDLICQENINTPKNIAEAQVRIENGECARYYLPSKVVRNRCLPFDNAVEQNSAISSHFNRALTTDVLKTNFKATNDGEEPFTKVVDDLSNCWKELIVYAIIALLVSLLFIFLFKWFTEFMTWICLILGICLFVYLAAYCVKKCLHTSDTVGKFSFYTAKRIWIGLAASFTIFAAGVLFMIICLRERIMLSMAILEETSKSVLSNIMSLFFPIVPWLLQLAVSVFTIYVTLYIIASSSSKYLHAINVFGFIWVTFFLGAFGQMVLSLNFATWYFTFDKDDVPFFGILNAMMITTRYHIGTLAFGSIIVEIVRDIGLILENNTPKARQGGNSSRKCSMSYLLRITKYINRQAYIMCAIHGTNLCTSAKNAFFLNMRNFLQVIVLNVATAVIRISELFITTIVVTLAYLISFSDTTAYNYYWLPVVIVGIFSYLVAILFFTVFDMGIDTLLTCYLQDLERNDGSSQKPYYISKNLMRLFDMKDV